MKCPECNTINSDSNKFCVECGYKLISQDDQAQVQKDDLAKQVVVQPEIELGEQLFDLWQLYDKGEHDSALAKGCEIAKNNPDNSSVHSVLALVYERKTEVEMASGNVKEARDYLRMALAEYEKVIDLNPDSAADREKLVLLRKRLAGHTPPVPVATKVQNLSARVQDAKEYVRRMVTQVPTPVFAAVGVFFIVMVVALIFMPGEKGSAGDKTGNSNVIKMDSAPNVQVNIPKPPPAKPRQSGGLSVHTFKVPTKAIGEDEEDDSAPSIASPVQNIDSNRPRNVEPMKLPPINGELTLVPEPKKTENQSASKKENKSGEAEAKISALPSVKTTEVKEESKDTTVPGSAFSGGDGALASAIRLANEGKKTEAISEAQRAISLFEADISEGKNVESAKRGQINARRLIQLWSNG